MRGVAKVLIPFQTCRRATHLLPCKCHTAVGVALVLSSVWIDVFICMETYPQMFECFVCYYYSFIQSVLGVLYTVQHVQTKSVKQTLMASTWATMRRFIDSLSLTSWQDLNIIKLDLYSLCIKYKQFCLIICVRPYGKHRHAPHRSIQCFVVSEKRIQIFVGFAFTLLPNRWMCYIEWTSGSLCTSKKQIWSKFWSESDQDDGGIGVGSSSIHPSWRTHTRTKSSAQIRDEIHSVQFTRRSDSWW